MLVGTKWCVEVGLKKYSFSCDQTIPELIDYLIMEDSISCLIRGKPVIDSESIDNAVALSQSSSRLGGKVQVRVALMSRQSFVTLEHSQYSPLKPSGHVHVKESTPSLHFPPFKHLESFNN